MNDKKRRRRKTKNRKAHKREVIIIMMMLMLRDDNYYDENTHKTRDGLCERGRKTQKDRYGQLDRQIDTKREKERKRPIEYGMKEMIKKNERKR